MLEVRQKLWNDNRFLRHLLHYITKRNTARDFIESNRYSTIEKRILRYLEYESSTHTLTGVEAIAFHLRCSRSQVQRALKKLLETGQIQKIGKGSYNY